MNNTKRVQLEEEIKIMTETNEIDVKKYHRESMNSSSLRKLRGLINIQTDKQKREDSNFKKKDEKGDTTTDNQETRENHQKILQKFIFH